MNEVYLTFLETNKTIIYGAPCDGFPDIFMEKLPGEPHLCTLFDIRDNTIEVWVHQTGEHTVVEQEQGTVCSIYDIHYDLTP